MFLTARKNTHKRKKPSEGATPSVSTSAVVRRKRRHQQAHQPAPLTDTPSTHRTHVSTHSHSTLPRTQSHTLPVGRPPAPQDQSPSSGSLPTSPVFTLRLRSLPAMTPGAPLQQSHRTIASAPPKQQHRHTPASGSTPASPVADPRLPPPLAASLPPALIPSSQSAASASASVHETDHNPSLNSLDRGAPLPRDFAAAGDQRPSSRHLVWIGSTTDPAKAAPRALASNTHCGYVLHLLIMFS